MEKLFRRADSPICDDVVAVVSFVAVVISVCRQNIQQNISY